MAQGQRSDGLQLLRPLIPTSVGTYRGLFQVRVQPLKIHVRSSDSQRLQTGSEDSHQTSASAYKTSAGEAVGIKEPAPSLVMQTGAALWEATGRLLKVKA